MFHPLNQRLLVRAHGEIVVFDQIPRFFHNILLLLLNITFNLIEVVLIGEVENNGKYQQYGNQNVHQQLSQDTSFRFHKVNVGKFVKVKIILRQLIGRNRANAVSVGT
jgi:hypothetical protein